MKWRLIQRKNITKFETLVTLLEIDKQHLLKKSNFPINIPIRLVNKMTKGDLNDPLFLQFVPLKQEEEKSKLFVLDPTGDQGAKKCQRILHKYHARALLLSTSACAMNCRYCFRRHFDYALDKEPILKSINYIKENTDLREIILSGGDPLSLSDKNLKELFALLNSIDHLDIIRIHSRFLTGIPERLTPELLQILSASKKTVIFVQHINHKKELDQQVLEALKKIQVLGIPVLTQTVLLKGVNDCVATLEALFWDLIKWGIIPYYLHQLDRVEGAIHFEVPTSKGVKIIEELKGRLPGYAIPKYVHEVPLRKSKTIIESSFI